MLRLATRLDVYGPTRIFGVGLGTCGGPVDACAQPGSVPWLSGDGTLVAHVTPGSEPRGDPPRDRQESRSTPRSSPTSRSAAVMERTLLAHPTATHPVLPARVQGRRQCVVASGGDRGGLADQCSSRQRGWLGDRVAVRRRCPLGGGQRRERRGLRTAGSWRNRQRSCRPPQRRRQGSRTRPRRQSGRWCWRRWTGAGSTPRTARRRLPATRPVRWGCPWRFGPGFRCPWRFGLG